MTLAFYALPVFAPGLRTCRTHGLTPIGTFDLGGLHFYTPFLRYDFLLA